MPVGFFLELVIGANVSLENLKSDATIYESNEKLHRPDRTQKGMKIHFHIREVYECIVAVYTQIVKHKKKEKRIRQRLYCAAKQSP